MKVAKTKQVEVPYIVYEGNNQEEVKEFFNHDRTLFEWEGSLTGRRKLIIKQDTESVVHVGEYVWKEDGVYYHADRANFLTLFDI